MTSLVGLFLFLRITGSQKMLLPLLLLTQTAVVPWPVLPVPGPRYLSGSPGPGLGRDILRIPSESTELRPEHMLFPLRRPNPVLRTLEEGEWWA